LGNSYLEGGRQTFM